MNKWVNIFNVIVTKTARNMAHEAKYYASLVLHFPWWGLECCSQVWFDCFRRASCLLMFEDRAAPSDVCLCRSHLPPDKLREHWAYWKSTLWLHMQTQTRIEMCLACLHSKQEQTRLLCLSLQGHESDAGHHQLYIHAKALRSALSKWSNMASGLYFT